MSTILYLGTGEATDPSSAPTCLLYRGSSTLLLDCAPGCLPELARALGSADSLDAVYLTHGHGDHILGLPILLLWMRTEGRGAPLEIVGSEDALGRARVLLDLVYPGAFSTGKCFPLLWTVVTAADEWRRGTLRCRFAPTDHGLPNLAIAISDEGTAVVYSGDGAPASSLLSLLEGASLWIQECFAVEPVPRHAALSQIVPMARAAGCPRVQLLHFARHEAGALRESIAALGEPFSAPKHGDLVHI